MKRWSKLKKQLYELVNESIYFKLHCMIYQMQSRRGSTDLPKDFVLKSGGVKSLAGGRSNENLSVW